MKFHPQKCEVLSVTRRRSPTNYRYTLHGIQLTRVKTAKYLGVTISSDLRWSHHVNNITAKANRTLGFLRRNLQVRNQRLKTTAYKSLVRPQVEYASSVWDPHTATDTKRVEMVQRTAARYVTNTWDRRASVSALLTDLGWSSLADRREQSRLAMIYNIHHGLVAVNQSHQYIAPLSRYSRGCIPPPLFRT